MQFLAWDPVFIYMRFFSNINEIFLNEIFLLCLWDFSQFVRFSPYVYELFLKLWAFSQIVRLISLINDLTGGKQSQLLVPRAWPSFI